MMRTSEPPPHWVLALLAILFDAARRSIPRSSKRRSALLRGACHRARIRATRWFAIAKCRFSHATNRPDGQITKSLTSPWRKNISLSASGKSLI